MMEPTKSKTVQLTFEEGTPHGIVNVKSLTSPYNIMAAPRNSLNQLPGEKTYQKPGNYLLKGETEEGLTLYVGQSDKVLKRIKQHKREREWWTHCCLLTCKSDWLNISHARYLEHRLYQLAQNNGGVKLDNDIVPTPSSLSEGQATAAENFLQAALLVLPLLGFDFFYDSSNAAQDARIPIFKLEIGNSNASARLQDDKWVVLKGSIARGEEADTLKTYAPGYSKQRERLIENKILQPQGEDMLKFIQDTPFTSSSAAASVVYGQLLNGRQTWKVPEEGKPYSQCQTYGEWEDSRPES